VFVLATLFFEYINKAFFILIVSKPICKGWTIFWKKIHSFTCKKYI